MTLGEKIKAARKRLKRTQSELCGEVITRNMLSAIERNKANPSLDTLKHLADTLNLPISYLVTEDDDLFFYEKQKLIFKIKEAYGEHKYSLCISLISKLSKADDELTYILAESHFALGKKAVMNGSLITALKHLEQAERCCAETLYSTHALEHSLLLYTALAKNIQSPLLELDVNRFESGADAEGDYEFYSYVKNNSAFIYKTPIFAKHMKAKNLMKNRKYQDAIKILCEIVDEKNPGSYNAYVMFGVYTDIEQCYKNLANFESAYKFASKRLSMLEGFKS